MRITVICPDVSQNGLGRSLLLAEVLALDHEVEIVGARFGRDVWAPAREATVPIWSVRGGYWPGYALSAARLVRRIRADVVYACKPLLGSLGVALLHRRLHGRPVVLDVDDDELAFLPPPSLRRPRSLVSAVGHPASRPWSAAAERQAGAADAVTVASRVLQRRYGGVVVPHVRDTDRMRPRPEAASDAKAALGVVGRRVVMFLGTPRRHKGLEDVAQAMSLLRAPAVFVVVGADLEDGYVRELRARYPDIVFHPPTTLEHGAFLLQAADAVVVPQRDEPAAAGQLPAKLIDGMALAKPIVATAVADIPEILAGGRGHVVPPGDVRALAAALDAIAAQPDEARDMGARAREWCVENASFHSARAVLRGVLDDVVQRRGAAGR
jgi:glycosyltransferase involved in cell wall biosynthesis